MLESKPGPPRLIQVAGDPRALGHAQGQALASAVHGAFDDLGQIESFRLRQPRWMPYRAFRALAAHHAESQLDAVVARESPAMHQRLLGLAEGARIAPRALWLLHAMEAVFGTVDPASPLPTPPPGACSALAVRGARSASGEPILVHNFDYMPVVQAYFFLRQSRPQDGLASLDFAVAPLAGAIDGMNERGLAITYNYAFTTDDAGPAPTLSLRIAEALAACESVADAIAYLSEKPRWGGGLLMLADATGDIAALELTNTHASVRRPDPGDDLLTHTNKFQCAASLAVELPLDAVYGPTAPASMRGIPVHESALRRDARYATLLADNAPLSPDTLARLMADHGPNGNPSLNTPCLHGPVWRTSACLQFFPARRCARVSFSTACDAHYHDVALDSARVLA